MIYLSFKPFTFVVLSIILNFTITPAVADDDTEVPTTQTSRPQYGLGKLPEIGLTKSDTSRQVEVIFEAENPPTRPRWMSVPENLAYLSWCVNPGPVATDVAANRKCQDGLNHLALHYKYMVEWNDATAPTKPKLPLRMLDSLPPEPPSN